MTERLLTAEEVAKLREDLDPTPGLYERFEIGYPDATRVVAMLEAWLAMQERLRGYVAALREQAEDNPSWVLGDEQRGIAAEIEARLDPPAPVTRAVVEPGAGGGAMSVGGCCLLFGGVKYYPLGGTQDLKGVFPSEAEARRAAEALIAASRGRSYSDPARVDWLECVSIEGGVVVACEEWLDPRHWSRGTGWQVKGAPRSERESAVANGGEKPAGGACSPSEPPAEIVPGIAGAWPEGAG